MSIKIVVGQDRDFLETSGVVEAETLTDAILKAGEVHDLHFEVARINQRTKRYAGRFKHRKQGKFDFYEYVARIGTYPDYRYVTKRISIATEDKAPYVSADEPWTMYSKDEDLTYVQFDFITDTLASVGWTDEATKGWHKAVRDDKKNLWVPANL